MGSKVFRVSLGLIFVALIAGCVKNQTTKPTAPINKVAVASFAVANWGGSVTGNGGTNEKTNEVINGAMSNLLYATEGQIGTIMHVTKIGSFIGSPSYRSMNVKNDLEILVPKVNGVPMPVFTNSNDEIIAGTLKPEVARKLCAELKVDAVVVVYTEWTTSVGRFVPTRKALAKNVITLWDRSGNLIFSKRVDQTGDAVIGTIGYSRGANEESIKQWVIAYKKGLVDIVNEMKKLKQKAA